MYRRAQNWVRTESALNEFQGRRRHRAAMIAGRVIGVSAGLGFAGAVGWLGVAGVTPGEPRPAFDSMVIFSGDTVNCNEVVGRYQPDHKYDQLIAGGAPSQFTNPTYKNGLLQHYRHVDAVAAHACQEYVKSVGEDNAAASLEQGITVELVPVEGRPRTFESVVTLSPVA